MRTVWKWTLDVGEVLPVMMHEGAELRHVEAQFNEICLWAQVDTAKPMVRRLLSVHGTGHPIVARDGIYPTYVGSATLFDGELVFHVFDHGEIT